MKQNAQTDKPTQRRIKTYYYSERLSAGTSSGNLWENIPARIRQELHEVRRVFLNTHSSSGLFIYLDWVSIGQNACYHGLWLPVWKERVEVEFDNVSGSNYWITWGMEYGCKYPWED